MKTTVTSNKTTGSTAEKKKAVASEKKAVVTSAPKAVATPKAVAKVATKKTTISKLPEGTQTAASASITTESIATRAYLLWEAAGYEHGRHEDHWLKAEQQLRKQAHS